MQNRWILCYRYRILGNVFLWRLWGRLAGLLPGLAGSLAAQTTALV